MNRKVFLIIGVSILLLGSALACNIGGAKQAVALHVVAERREGLPDLAADRLRRDLLAPDPRVHAREAVVYPGPLAIHLLSVELLLVWFPFGKLMHAILFIPGRAQLGMLNERRGVRS